MGRSPLNRTCDTDGCEKKHLARGLCSTHYNRTYQPDRHPRYRITCESCGREHETPRKGGKYCSLSCRDIARSTGRFCAWPRETPALPVPWVRPEWKPKHTKGDATWVSGPCHWCGDTFTAYTYYDLPKYCSLACDRRRARAIRRAREVDATGTYTWAEVVRKWISISRRCAYCDRPTPLDVLEPDHVHPLSRGGSNSITNLVPACRECNGHKRNLMLTEWYADRALRGMKPRILNPVLRAALTSDLAA